jgi:hypothetical protein
MRRLALSLLVLGLCSCGGAHRSRIPVGPSEDGGAAPAASDAPPADSAAAIEAPPPADAPPVPADSAPPPSAPSALMRSSGGGSYGIAATEATGLSREDAVKSLEGVGPAADKCYEKLFKKKKDAAGKTVVEVKVDPKGKTKGAAKVVSDDVKDKALAKCLQGAFKKAAWPKPTEKGGGKVTVEFALSGAPAAAPKLAASAPPRRRAGRPSGVDRGRAVATLLERFSLGFDAARPSRRGPSVRDEPRGWCRGRVKSNLEPW